MNTSVKICGVTTFEDATASIQAGARALGFVFYGKSPRCLTVTQTAQITSRLPANVKKVGVFVNVHVEQVLDTVLRAGLDMAQLSGDESPDECAWLTSRDVKIVKAVRPRTPDDVKRLSRYKDCVHAFNVDGYREGQYGGTGVTSDWSLAKDVKAYGRPVILSGGLGPKNIGDALRSVEPAALDVCSSVEREPGRKDASKLKLLFDAVKKAEEALRIGRTAGTDSWAGAPSVAGRAGMTSESPPPPAAPTGPPVLVLGGGAFARGSGVQVAGTGSGSGFGAGPVVGAGSSGAGAVVGAGSGVGTGSGVGSGAAAGAPGPWARMSAPTPPGGPGSVTPIPFTPMPTSPVPAPPANAGRALGAAPAYAGQTSRPAPAQPPQSRPLDETQPNTRPADETQASYLSVSPARLRIEGSVDEIPLVDFASQSAAIPATPARQPAPTPPRQAAPPPPPTPTTRQPAPALSGEGKPLPDPLQPRAPSRPVPAPPPSPDDATSAIATVVIGEEGFGSKGEKTLKTSRASVPIQPPQPPQQQQQLPQPRSQPQPPPAPAAPTPPPAAPSFADAGAGAPSAQGAPPVSARPGTLKVRKLGHFDSLPPEQKGTPPE